ncbi:alpha-protein kinase 2-like [Colossoma macropomum]|uniref:alpha-protein kinase 2-like n=1 Tax=Colossoma macropomum TaxID=42526 RepID=UPI00186531C9|nr:alpha-protein kinase 2-like [Colossoma macropomum]
MKNSVEETNNVNPVPEVPVTQEPLYKLVVELNKPDTVCATPVLRQPVTQPSSMELTDNNLDCQSSALIFDQAIANPNAMQGNSLADSTANLLENVLTQTTQNLVTESKLDIVVSESCLLEDPVLDRTPALMLHQLGPMVFSRTDPVVDNMTENNSDTHLLFPGFLHTSIETPQISEEAGTDLPLLDLCSTPAAVQESSYRGMEDELSNDLWMDACQFLTIEEDRGSIYDEWGHSPDPSPPRASPNNIKSLASSQGRGAVIGQLGDWELPPVERWSSSDSWASALSDWFQSVSVFTEDRPLAAPTTSSSNPLDSQPQPCMAVQDTTEQQKDSPESPSTTGQVCLPPSSTEAGVDAQSRRLPRDEETLLQLAETDMHLHAGTQDLPGESVDTQEERKMEVETLNPSGACVPNLGSHLREGTVAPVMSVKDFTTGKLTNQHISGTKPDSDGVQEVAEDRTFRLSADFEEESVRNYSPLRISGYPSDKDPAIGCACGPCLDTHVPQLDRHVPSEPKHLTQAEGVETPHAEGSRSRACFYTQDPETTQGQSRSEDPEFIMPFAPISIGTSFHHPCDLKEGQPSPKTSTKPSLVGNIDEIRGCLPAKIVGKVTSGQEPSDDQFCTCSEKSSEQSSSAFEAQRSLPLKKPKLRYKRPVTSAMNFPS